MSVSSNFNCSQNAFVSTANLCINLLTEHSADLMTVKPKYTVPFFDALRSDLQAADLMPDDKTRRAFTADAVLAFEEDRAAFVKSAAFFKSYIADSFDKSRRDNAYGQAGFDYFMKAKNGDWASMTGFISSAVPFLEDNKAALLANDTMPTTFIADFNVAIAKMQTRYNAWLALAKGMSKADAKVEALNAVNTTLMAALKTGQLFYEDTNPALAEQFTFSAQLAQVQGTKHAGINGKVLDANAQPVPNVGVSIKGNAKTVGCDADGRYEYTPLSMGKYAVTFSATGYVTQVFEAEAVKTGVMSRLNVTLVAVA